MEIPDVIYGKVWGNEMVAFETPENSGEDKYYHSSIVEALKAENEALKAEALNVHCDFILGVIGSLTEALKENEAMKAELEKRQWVKTKDRLPEKPGKKSYEYVDCLIYHNGEILQRPWNCEHLCWDDAHYDDFFCNPLEPTHWMPLPAAPEVKE